MKMKDILKDALLSAGSVVRTSFNEGKNADFEEKGKNDFVTETDRRSEEMIKDILGSAYPDIPFLAEETSMEIAASRFWIIDPLDGTTNFIHRYPSVGISVALFDEGEVVLGMVLDPLSGELFEAMKGEGALCDGTPISVSKGRAIGDALIGTGFPFTVHEYLDLYLETFRKVFTVSSGVRRAGAATLDLCHLAAGRLDGFWELYLKPWDMAAGALIVKEAGGMVSDFFGGPDYLNRGNIVAGPPDIYSRLLTITEEVFSNTDISDIANNLIRIDMWE